MPMSEADVKKKISAAIKAAKQADTLAEKACMASMDVFNLLNFGGEYLTPGGEAVKNRTDKAHNIGGDARANLANMVHELEQALARVGR